MCAKKDSITRDHQTLNGLDKSSVIRKKSDQQNVNPTYGRSHQIRRTIGYIKWCVLNCVSSTYMDDSPSTLKSLEMNAQTLRLADLEDLLAYRQIHKRDPNAFEDHIGSLGNSQWL